MGTVACRGCSVRWLVFNPVSAVARSLAHGVVLMVQVSRTEAEALRERGHRLALRRLVFARDILGHYEAGRYARGAVVFAECTEAVLSGEGEAKSSD